MSEYPADPAAYRVAWERGRGGRLVRVVVLVREGGEILATYRDDDGGLSGVLSCASQLERADPYAGKLPSDAALVRAVLADYGIG